ncbi:MAG: pilus assembly protein PilM [Chthoniobacterales bacterium]
MATPRKILVLDLGMQSLRLAEFSASPEGGLRLLRGARREFLLDPALDTSRPDQIRVALQEILKRWKLKSGEVVCVLPSHTVFTRAVPLDVPGGASGNVDAIVRFEAHQNIPFPLEEVVWDYVAMGETGTGAVNVVFVAVKSDLLEAIGQAVSSSGLNIASVTVSPLALYDAFRHAGLPDSGAPALLLDIGSRTTNMVIASADSFFSRSIPSGGLAVTMAIAKDIHAGLEEAERLKVDRASVGLGPGFEPPADPVEANLARVARQALLKTQADISRSLGYYRSTLGGKEPSEILLTGGMASMPYLSEFIQEKFQKGTGFFNPMKGVSATGEATQFLESHTHNMGELVGGAMELLPEYRTIINLLPPSILRKQSFIRRLPYLATAAALMIATLGAWYLFANNATKVTVQKTEEITQLSKQADAVAEKLRSLQKKQDEIRKTSGELLNVILLREAYPKIIAELAAKVPDRFLWITEVQPAVESPSKNSVRNAMEKGAEKGTENAVKAVIVKGLYLDNPRQASVIDDFVTSLQSSELFVVEEKEITKVITQRGSPSGEYWAYPFALRIPLRTPIPNLP